MAKILNKDPVTYQRERDGFIRDLRQFHETRGTPFRKTPKINGREIDLYLLYVLVTAHGGWIKVNSRNEWESLLDHFGLTKHCVNGSVGLKQIYLRYLDRYEKVHYLGEDVDRGSDDDEESRHRRWSARALHSVPLTYNHHQHNVADTLRSYNGLSVNLYKPSDYDRLSLSLISPLPNEQDFAINVCTLLSNEGKHTLKLDKCPRLIDFLLAHAGVFNHSSLRQLFEEVYGKVRKHSVHCFWTDALGDSDMGDLEDETKFPTAKSKIKEVICDDTGGKGVVAGASSLTDKFSRSSSRCSDRIGTKTTDVEPPKFLMDSDGAGEKPVVEKMEVDETPSKTENEKEKTVDSSSAMDVESDVPEKTNSAEDGERTGATKVFEEGEDGLLSEVDSQKAKTENHLRVPLKIEPSDLELFCLGRSFGTQDYIGQRVLQVATILRNLSFGEENVSVLARSVPFLRFLLLCASSKWNQLHQLGLDMLGNVAGEVILEDPGYDRLASCLLSTVTRGLHSQDRYVVVSCLEVLNKLSQKDENEDVMLRCLDQQVYDQVCTFLTLHDIMLLIHTLECLYSLSSLGERACNNIVRVHGAIDTLVSLITVEAQSYGPKACILMRVVETVSGTQSAATTTTTTTSTAMAANPSPQPMMATPVRPPLSALPHRHTPQRIWVSSAGMVVGAPQPAVATPVHLTLAQNPHPYHPPPPPPPQQQQQQQQPPPPPPPPQQPQQQQPLVHQQAAQENEQFALAWLRATFEPAAGCRIEQAELYKQYLTACAKIGRRGVIAPLHFPRCVRSVFGGSVGPNPQKSMVGVTGGAEQPSGSILMFYEGIKVRPAPFTIPVSASSSVQHVQQPSAAQVILQTQSSHVQRKGITVVSKTVTPSPPPPPPPQAPTPPATQVVITENPSTGGDVSLSLTPAPASPILKAQLSAPPKQREASKADVKSQVLAHPHLTQALLGSSGGSPSPAGSKPAMVGSSKDTQAGGNGPPSSSTSLIKSLLATKVNATGSECMMAQPTAAVAASSMLPAACSTTTTTTTASTSTKQTLPHAPQVTQRQQQQRLLQQQLQQKKDSISPPPAPVLSTSSSNNIQGKVITVQAATPSKGKPAAVVTTSTTVVKPTPDPRQRISRINGARTPLQVQPQAATALQQTQVQTQANSQAQVQPQIQQQVDSMKDAEDSSTNSNSITCSNENSSNSDTSGGATNSTNTGIPTSCGTSVITQAPPKLVAENHVPPPAFSVNSSNAALRGRREPPQPPPPPLAPLSNSRIPPRLDLEDSDSTGNNSLASSSRDCSAIGTGNISTDDGENSLTSFEGLLLNGIPHPLDIDAASNDSSSKDSARSLPHLQNQSLKPPTTKSLMLADLLEKKVDKKDPPVINGILPKELRIGEKGLELVENHLEKVLKETSVIQAKPSEVKEASRNTGGVSGSDVSGVVRTAGQVANNVTNAEKDNSAFKTVGIGTTDEPLLTNSVVCSTEHIRFGVATQQTQTVQATKRPAAETIGLEDGEVEAKRPHLSSENAVNGSASPGPVNPSNTGPEQSNPAPPSPDSNDKSSNASNDNSEGVNASPSAANLYAALAASALEDEPDLDLTPPPPPAAQVLVQSAGGLRQAVFLGQGVDPSQQQQLIVAAPRQIIVSQGQIAPQGQVLISAGGQLTLQQNPNTGTIKASSGHQGVPVLVQTGSSASQRAQIAAVSHSQAPQLVQTGQVVLSQSSSGQFILSQAPAQGQVQLVQTGSGQASQYIVQASSSSGQAHYVVAQPQTALVQGQTQTVLVAQTQQQQGTGTKTIIILQPQSSSSATHHQKVVVTPQGQPVVVTQVPRPILQSSAISSPSSTIQPPALVPTSSAQPPSPASPAPQTIKHVSSTAAPVHMPSRVVQSTPHSGSTGTSTSLPPQSRALTPNPPSTGVVTITSTLATATKTISKPQTVHPSITSTVSRAPLSPSANSVNIVKAGTVSVATAATTSSAAFQSKQQSRVLPNSRPQTPGMVPEASPIQEKSVIQHPVRVGTPSPMQTRSQTPQHRAGMTPSLDQALFLCEWRGCMRSFKSANEVYMHACEAHCPSGSEEIQCLWERCDAMKRKRFSLMTHLYDRHCNADVLRMMAVRRRQLSQSGRSEIPPPQPPPPHPGYAPNAAFHAIKRHALEFVNPKEMMDDNEGPVTKSIRLTSSLILRNLVIYSTNGRRFLRSYEPHLASVALSNVESSRTIAQVLYDMNQQTSRR